MSFNGQRARRVISKGRRILQADVTTLILVLSKCFAMFHRSCLSLFLSFIFRTSLSHNVVLYLPGVQSNSYRLGHRYCTSKFVAYPSYKIQCERSFYLILTYNLVDFDCVQYVYVWILWLPCLILFVTWELLTKIKPSNLSFNITRHPSHPTQALVYLFAGHSSLSLWFLSLRLLRCKVRV